MSNPFNGGARRTSRARTSIELPRSPQTPSSPKSSPKSPARRSGRGQRSGGGGAKTGAEPKRRPSWRKEAEETAASSRSSGDGNSVPLGRRKPATPDFGGEEEETGELFDVWTEEAQSVDACISCQTPFVPGAVACSHCGAKRNPDEDQESDKSDAMDLTAYGRNSSVFSDPFSSSDAQAEAVQLVERTDKKLRTHDLTSARDGNDSDKESNDMQEDYVNGGGERKGAAKICEELLEAQKLNKQYESRIAELEKKAKSGRADAAAITNLRTEFRSELEERDDRAEDLEFKTEQLEQQLGIKDSEIKKYRTDLRQAKQKLQELESEQAKMEQARDDWQQQDVELAITKNELQEANEMLAGKAPRGPSAVETALTAELQEEERVLRKTKKDYAELENETKAVLGDLESEVRRGSESRRLSKLEISEHSKRLLQAQEALERTRSQAEMTKNVNDQLSRAKEELTAEKQLADKALRDSDARISLELSSVRQENIIQNAREIEALHNELTASKRATISAEGKLAAKVRQAEQTAEVCTREAEEAIARSERLELRLQRQSVNESFENYLEGEMAETLQKYGEARGEAATWKEMSADANQANQKAQKKLMNEVSMYAAQKHQLHEAEERAKNAAGVQKQVGEALTALATMRKELANAREEEWRQGHALDLLNETREELHQTEEIEQEASNELETMVAFKAKFLETESALVEARSRIDEFRGMSAQADHALNALPEVQLELAEARAQYFQSSSELIKARQVERDSVDAGEALIAAHTELSNVLYQKRLAQEAAERAEHAEKIAQTQRKADARTLQNGMHESRELKSKNEELKSAVRALEAQVEAQKRSLEESRSRERSQESRLLLLSEALDDSEIHFREARNDAAQLGRKLDESNARDKQLEDSRSSVARVTGELVKQQSVVSIEVEADTSSERLRDDLRISVDEAMEAQLAAQRLAEALDRRGRPLLDVLPEMLGCKEEPKANNSFDDAPSQAEVEFLERFTPDLFGSLSPVPISTSDLPTLECSPEAVAPTLAMLQTPNSGRRAPFVRNGTSDAPAFMPHQEAADFNVLEKDSRATAMIGTAPGASLHSRPKQLAERLGMDLGYASSRPVSAQHTADLSQLPLDQTTRLREQTTAAVPWLMARSGDPAVEAVLEDAKTESLRKNALANSTPATLLPETVHDSEVADVIAQAAREARLVLQDLAYAKSRLASNSGHTPWPELTGQKSLMGGFGSNSLCAELSPHRPPSGVDISSWPLPWPPPSVMPESLASGLEVRNSHHASLAMVQQSRNERNTAP